MPKRKASNIVNFAAKRKLPVLKWTSNGNLQIYNIDDWFSDFPPQLKRSRTVPRPKK